MRAFNPSTVARAGASAVRNVGFHHRSNLPSKITCSSISSVRHKSHTTEPNMATTWAQHPLKSPKPSNGSSSPVFSSSKIPRKTHTAYIALGSNLGDRIEMIERACNEMSARGIKIKRTSSLWETEPMYVLDQGNFVNGACEVKTTLEPIALLDELQDIENSMGREKLIDKGPRNIDLDILIYDGEVINHKRLKVPHPGMYEREFVLRPLAELIPDQPLDPAAPWKLTQDYLNAIPLSSQLSTLTPLGPFTEPIRALKANRKTHVMRILNATPDSFSDGGLHFRKLDASAAHDGNFWTQTNSEPDDPSTFSIVDVGGQSSAPGAKDISAEEEISRVVPFIEAMKEFYHGKAVALSVDTYRASVAEAAVNAGAEIINDISAGQLDPDMLPTMARLGKTICLSHMRGTPATMNGLVDYSPDGLIPTLASELQARVAAAEEAGIRRWRIILDPGIGFAKTQTQNLEILRRLDELRDWPGLRGLPWLVGTSRKRFVGRITGVQEPKQRVWGTAATVAAAVQGGADIVRVHDAQEMAQVVKMSDAIWRY